MGITTKPNEQQQPIPASGMLSSMFSSKTGEQNPSGLALPLDEAAREQIAYSNRVGGNSGIQSSGRNFSVSSNSVPQQNAMDYGGYADMYSNYGIAPQANSSGVSPFALQTNQLNKPGDAGQIDNEAIPLDYGIDGSSASRQGENITINVFAPQIRKKNAKKTNY